MSYLANHVPTAIQKPEIWVRNPQEVAHRCIFGLCPLFHTVTGPHQVGRYAGLVSATVGVGTVLMWDLCVDWTRVCLILAPSSFPTHLNWHGRPSIGGANTRTVVYSPHAARVWHKYSLCIRNLKCESCGFKVQRCVLDVSQIQMYLSCLSMYCCNQTDVVCGTSTYCRHA